jgi:hypothetical protein
MEEKGFYAVIYRDKKMCRKTEIIIDDNVDSKEKALNTFKMMCNDIHWIIEVIEINLTGL